MITKFKFLASAFVLAGLIAVCTNAATFTVTKTADTNDGICDTDCSLREAVASANGLSTADVIEFSPTVFASPQTIILGGSQLTITSNGSLTIHGPGANFLWVSGNNSSRVFYVNPAANLTLSGLTITNGADDFGGGISNFATLNLQDAEVTGNSTVGNGGGINNGGTVNLINSTVSGNTSHGHGGGISNVGVLLNVSNSTVSGNSAGGRGGGISSTGNLRVINSNISGNSAADGGGILNSGLGGLSLTNSTVTGNSAGDGGGIHSSTHANLTNSTVAGNSADLGGGVFNFQSTVVARNSIIAGNTAATSRPDFFGTLTSQGYNLIGNAQGVSITGTISGNILDVDPQLAPLAYNGGPTMTRALLVGSPAINAGNNALAVDYLDQPLISDQRGASYPRILDGTTDIGAVEFTAPLSFVVDTTSDDGNLTACTGAGNDCSLRGAITRANSSLGADSIGFDSNFFTHQSITLTGGELSVADSGSLTINGSGANLLSISGNNAGRVFLVNRGASLVLHGISVINGNSGSDVGGGVKNSGGTVSLTNLTVSGNSAGIGGGISNDGRLSITQSTVAGNQSEVGGGIANVGGTITLTNSTVAGNTAGINGGGGIETFGTLNILNSTISGNSAGIGGGILINGGSAFVGNSTVASNVANVAGGIKNGGKVSAIESIFAANLASSDPDFVGTINSFGYNLIGNNSGTIITGLTVGNILNQDARLAPLGFYGGSTMTHALLSASPAINSGTGNALTDQRGALRVGASDIGAFELNNSSNGGTFSATLPEGHVNTGYSFILIPEAGTTTYCISSGNLPLGMTGLPYCVPPLAESNKRSDLVPTESVALAGTPTQNGVFSFAVTATSGGNSNLTNYTVNIIAPTAANVSVGGRVMTSDGRGLRNAIVTVTDQNGNSRNTRTGTFGFFRFDELEGGQVFLFAVSAKSQRFLPQVVMITEELTELNLIAQ